MKGQAVQASFWKRFFAYVLDILLLTFVILSPLLDPFELEGTNTFSEIFSFSFSWEYVVLTCVLVFLVLLYWSFMECWFGQSVGKMILGLTVQSTKKKDISFLQAVIRNIPKLSSFLLFLDTLYMLLKKRDQRFFEVLSDTRVVVEEKHHD